MFSKMKLVNNTGLESERNLRFVNTSLQLLHRVPRMKQFFKMKEYRLSNEHKRNMEICDEVARLFNTVKHFTLSAAELRRLVATKSGRHYLKDGSQQDTVEFLVTLLTEVENEISDDNWEAKTVVQEFWGIEKKEKKFLTNSGICSKCNSGPRQEVERFQVLQVDIPETNSVLTLTSILENYFSESSDIGKMRCNCCTHKINCPESGVCKPKPFVSKKVIMKSPDILLVQVNRYKNVTGTKMKTTVWPDEYLRLPSGDEYTLCGIGHHLGESFNGGHYVASVHSDEEWILCNDTQILNSSESDSKSMECNVCIYTQVRGGSYQKVKKLSPLIGVMIKFKVYETHFL
jgi:ubiquitin C-terminal hydrolase